MLTWKVYYEEYQRRQTLLDEARQIRLINTFLNIKENRSKKSDRMVTWKFKSIGGVKNA